MTARRITRRQALARMGVLGLSAVGLAACDVSTDTGGSSGDGAPSPDFDFDIPDSGAQIPSEDVTIGWMDSGDLKAMFEEPFFRAYEAKYPNITVDYQPSGWDTINEAIPVAVRNDSAPDVFAVPNNVPTSVAVNEGWIQPIDDIVPDFEEWKAGFPEGSFIPGIHEFDGKTYTWPMNSSRRFDYIQFTHPPLLEEAGYDAAEPLTFSDFRDACQKITENGAGDYYGLILSGNQVMNTVLSWAQRMGLPILFQSIFRGYDSRTGEFSFVAPEVIEAFELLQALEADGSLFPGYASLDGATVRSRFPQGVAGFLFDGPWAIPPFQTDTPDFEFSVGVPPTADDGTSYTSPFLEQGANFAFVSASTPNTAIIGDMFSYLGSVEGQANIIVHSEGNLSSVIPEANELAAQSTELNDAAVAAVEVAQEILRAAPDPRIRNADSAQVVLEFKPPSPSGVEVGQAIMSGQAELRPALQQLQDASNQALDDAIAAAQAKGAQVTREDWAFPNWDPTRDYTADDYAGL